MPTIIKGSDLMNLGRLMADLEHAAGVPVEKIDRVAKAIESIPFDYSIKLIRLVDGISTYEVKCGGYEPVEFTSYQDAMDHCALWRSRLQARAAIKILFARS